MIIQALSTWIITHGNPALKELEVFKKDVQDEITEMIRKMEELSSENEELKFQNKGLKQDTEQLTLELERVEVDNANLRQEKELQKRLTPDIAGNAALIGGLEETLETSEKQRADTEVAFQRLKKDYEFLSSDMEGAKQRIETQSNYIAALENKLEAMDVNINQIEKKHQQATQLIAQEQAQFLRAIEKENLQLQIEVERASQMKVSTEATENEEDDKSIPRYAVKKKKLLV
ncbi:viral A-type inclusion protein [Reticulomyxa filosa]|uniref:Viral A-type inclusion protein n=1 Tax=Reticulomyxa filosa TaxID=46433 RepID=X6NZL2_RETFI|nr:viral A-type inclusion protein [Reticulomyxa filosa]|eukprot:ETO30737.1 viral A-type inclusion protein [Reticulomyxa filosa]